MSCIPDTSPFWEAACSTSPFCEAACWHGITLVLDNLKVFCWDSHELPAGSCCRGRLILLVSKDNDYHLKIELLYVRTAYIYVYMYIHMETTALWFNNPAKHFSQDVRTTAAHSRGRGMRPIISLACGFGLSQS